MNDLIVIPGSITNIAKGGDTALALMNAKVLLICDRSGSMSGPAFGGKARHQIEDEIVTRLQKRYPGQVALMAFNSQAWMCLDGHLPEPSADTYITSALELAKPLVETGLHAILLSDGEPSEPDSEVLRAAKGFNGHLDVIYIGDDHAPGAVFMQQLAAMVHGSFDVNDLQKDPIMLERSLERLMLKAGAR